MTVPLCKFLLSFFKSVSVHQMKMNRYYIFLYICRNPSPSKFNIHEVSLTLFGIGACPYPIL